MASSRKSSSTVYETIWNHIDERLKKSENTIKRIRWELFDIITLGDEKSRTNIWNKIKSELEKKLSDKENLIKEKRKQWEITTKREERKIKN